MFLRTLVAVTLFAGFAIAAEPMIVSPEGYGPVRFGEKLTAVEKDLGEKSALITEEGSDDSCGYVKFKKLPGVMFMVEKGVVTRVDVHDDKIANSAKLSVGTSLASARRLQPKLRVKKNAYDDKAHDLVLKTEDGKKALLFEESNGKIISVRAGLEPSVEYIEGCL